jgi:hypothetical protein
LKYIIKTIPHTEQRYNTPADYTTDEEGVTSILVSELGNVDSEMGVALHEFIESHLCRMAGVTDEEIDAWDMQFDQRADADEYAEPGDHPEAPYHEQHKFALKMERLFIEQAGHNWDEHDKRVLSVCEQ